jgi:hypothetical protein
MRCRAKMNRCAKWVAVLIGLMALLGMVHPIWAKSASKAKTLRVIYTTRVDGQLNSDAKGRGGAAKLAALIKANRTDNTIVVDGGGFGNGLLNAAVYGEAGDPWSLMGTMGYDAALQTNDNRFAAYSKQAKAVKTQKNQAPKIVSRSAPSALAKQTERIAVFNKGGIKVGVMALSSGGSFWTTAQQARQDIARLKDNHCDVIVALSDLTDSQNKTIARLNHRINIIVDGRSGREIDDPITAGKAAIVSAGKNGTQIGVMDYRVDTQEVKTDGLIPMGANVKNDQDTADQVGQISAALTQQIDPSKVLAVSQQDFTSKKTRTKKFADNDTGNLVSDAYAAQADGAVGVVAESSLKDGLALGDVTVQNIVDLFSRNSGRLVKLTVSGETLRDFCEVDATIGYLATGRQLYFSGLTYDYAPSRTPFNRVTQVRVKSGGKWQAVRADRQYTVITDQGTAAELKAAPMKMAVQKQKTLGRLGWQAAAATIKGLNKSGEASLSANYVVTRDSKKANPIQSVSDYLSHSSRFGVLIDCVAIVVLALIVSAIIAGQSKKRNGLARRPQRWRKL